MRFLTNEEAGEIMERNNSMELDNLFIDALTDKYFLLEKGEDAIYIEGWFDDMATAFMSKQDLLLYRSRLDARSRINFNKHLPKSLLEYVRSEED